MPGAALFGVWWAISGGCPAIPIIQIGSGYLPALVSIAGVVVGIRLCRWTTTTYLHINTGSCGT